MRRAHYRTYKFLSIITPGILLILQAACTTGRIETRALSQPQDSETKTDTASTPSVSPSEDLKDETIESEEEGKKKKDKKEKKSKKE